MTKRIRNVLTCFIIASTLTTGNGMISQAAETTLATNTVEQAVAKTPSTQPTITKLTTTPIISKVSAISLKRLKLVNYALKFKGNPYIWGGTSLTRGADCSGFTQSVFRDNGIRIPRTSREQAKSGQKISIKNIRRGDLIFYDRNGTINHVGIYIGNGKVISASTPKTGIRITNYKYRTPVKAVRYLK